MENKSLFEEAFWEQKSLLEMSDAEWESLCDGCAKCCLHKLEDEASGDVYYTSVACRLLDLNTCRCTNYQGRSQEVKDCMNLNKSIHSLSWLPPSCAYRLVSESQPLPEWHHLICGSRTMIHETGHSIMGRVIAEQSVDEYEDYIVEWPILHPSE